MAASRAPAFTGKDNKATIHIFGRWLEYLASSFFTRHIESSQPENGLKSCPIIWQGKPSHKGSTPTGSSKPDASFQIFFRLSD